MGGLLTRRAAEFPGEAPRLAGWLGGTAAETLARYVLGRGDVRRKLSPANAIERHLGEVRRRTRGIRIFTHEARLHRPLTALATEANDRWPLQRWFIALAFEREEPPMQRAG